MNRIQPVDDLPPEAKELIEKVGIQVGKIQDKAEKETAAIRTRADREIEELSERARQKVEAQIEKAIADLKPLQQSALREGLLDEALAIRDQIRQLKTNQGGTEPDPGTLVGLHAEVGRSFSFDVTGSMNGAVWGTDVYTSDSTLAVAAVHAGKVRPGERKVVRVTIVQPPAGFQGSTRNGVTSSAYGPYPGAYRIG